MRKTFHTKKGMTLVEVIVALSILITLLGLGLIFGLDSYRSYLFRSEISTAVSVLERARSRALSNMYETVHGVCYETNTNSYVLFRTSYTSSGTYERIPGTPGTTVSPGSFSCSTGPGIVFSQLSGTTTSVTLTISNSFESGNITINNEGTIIW